MGATNNFWLGEAVELKGDKQKAMQRMASYKGRSIVVTSVAYDQFLWRVSVLIDGKPLQSWSGRICRGDDGFKGTFGKAGKAVRDSINGKIAK